jgi:hypothetical protein
LGRKLGYRKPEDWYGDRFVVIATVLVILLFRYRIKKVDFLSNRGRPLLLKYGGFPSDVILQVLPELGLLPWFFKHPSMFFTKRENRQSYIDWLVKEVGVKSPEYLKGDHFKSNHGAGLLRTYLESPLAVINSLADTDDESKLVVLKSHVPNKFFVRIQPSLLSRVVLSLFLGNLGEPA